MDKRYSSQLNSRHGSMCYEIPAMAATLLCMCTTLQLHAGQVLAHIS